MAAALLALLLLLLLTGAGSEEHTSPACETALRGHCSTDAAKAHSPFASETCAVCAGKLQHQLRAAGCTQADISSYCSAQPWQPSPDRSVAWSPGVPGGIPRYPDGVSVADFGAKGDGVSDDAGAFAAAVAACAPGHAVLVPPGTFVLGRRVDLRASIAIRGASGNRSAIIATHTDTVFYLSRSTSWGSPIPIGGAVAGATSLTVADIGGLSVGDYVRIEQEDDPEWVDLKGCDGECSWCGECAGGQGHNCAMAQMSRVTSVQGHGEVALARPLFWGFSLRPQLVPITMLEGAGIEQLYIRRTQPAEAETVLLKQCAGCWVRDIESADAGKAHVRVDRSFACEIRDSYLHGAFSHGSDHGYGVRLSDRNSDVLVENNVIWQARHSLVMESAVRATISKPTCAKLACSFANPVRLCLSACRGAATCSRTTPPPTRSRMDRTLCPRTSRATVPTRS